MEPRRQRRDHQYYEDLLGAVALGAATPEERQAVLTHVSECPTCRAELAELRAAVTVLPLMLEEREPSPILRYRIQAVVQHELTTGIQLDEPRDVPLEPDGAEAASPPATAPEPIRRRSPAVFIWAAAALFLLAVSAGLVLWNLTLMQDQQRRDDNVDTIAVNLDIASPPANAGAELTYLQDREVFLLSVRNLPELTEEEVFQVWLIGEGDPVSVGTFGSETAEVAVAADRSQWAALAVSVEPGPVGSPGPTTTPILVADISNEPTAETWTQLATVTSVANERAPEPPSGGAVGGMSLPDETDTERPSTAEETAPPTTRPDPGRDSTDGSEGGGNGGTSGRDPTGGTESGGNGRTSGGDSSGGTSGGETGGGGDETSGEWEPPGGGDGTSGGGAPPGGDNRSETVADDVLDTVEDTVEVPKVNPTAVSIEVPELIPTEDTVEIPELIPTLPS